MSNKTENAAGPDFDSIVFGGSARWLAEHRLLPSSWRLEPREVDRILRAGVKLNVLSSPVTVIDLRPQGPFVFAGRLVCFSAELMEGGGLSREEAIATILHEIGHVVNVFQSKYPIGTAEWYSEERDRKATDAAEHDADDYARQCGFGEHLANALEKLASGTFSGFKGDGIKKRIERLRSANKPLHKEVQEE